jgi:hypothetical protein
MRCFGALLAAVRCDIKFKAVRVEWAFEVASWPMLYSAHALYIDGFIKR